jgi:NhaP-type Na+/H+ or K+/H+ antiporter
MEATALLYVGAGAAALLAALLPRLIGRLPVSMPMVFLGLGLLAYLLIPDLPSPDPREHGVITEHLTEVIVLVALFGAGLALDRPVGWRRWNSTWLLLAVTMPLTILAMTLIGMSLLGLGVASALLLGALLAPTDPVLASDVQVGEPTDVDEGDEGDVEDEPRFALTSEAGLNDALAFPFVYAAIAMAEHGAHPAGWFAEWAAVDLAWRLLAGAAAGYLIGRVVGRLVFGSRRNGGRLAEEAEGFVALACTLLAYGAAELIEGYGFIAVFVCACTIRAAERAHDYHTVLHGFIEQVERLLTAGLLLLLGGAIARGLLDALRPADVVAAVLLLLVVRPLAGWVALPGGGRGRRDRAVIAFFGVRGIGSLYYLSYGLNHAEFEGADRLWAVTGLVVLLSVVIHGMSATPAMRIVDRRRARKAAETGRNPRSREVPV